MNKRKKTKQFYLTWAEIATCGPSPLLPRSPLRPIPHAKTLAARLFLAPLKPEPARQLTPLPREDSHTSLFTDRTCQCRSHVRMLASSLPWRVGPNVQNLLPVKLRSGLLHRNRLKSPGVPLLGFSSPRRGLLPLLYKCTRQPPLVQLITHARASPWPWEKKCAAAGAIRMGHRSERYGSSGRLAGGISGG
jgi:hypothetical protein